MEDFNSETDSDYTSYWRDWVGLFRFDGLRYAARVPHDISCDWRTAGGCGFASMAASDLFKAQPLERVGRRCTCVLGVWLAAAICRHLLLPSLFSAV